MTLAASKLMESTAPAPRIDVRRLVLARRREPKTPPNLGVADHRD